MLFRTPATPTPPDSDEEEEAVNSIANSMLMMRAGLTPVFDAADGMRADLLARGWSPHIAEALTYVWLQRVITNLTPLVNAGGTA
ncbi:hypothetical protein [Streptomyces sp. SP17KL33]|uniref:hypothetical protein n=1 Tax=Streptomyces sp. SP17KL33 TaxID=3002534 RepID=UPI002E76FC6F|nr:hypothetical protein [Streptomyces sp. SP17KL33]MEE1838130.1 hypothetical protein [Streptomyces sp. SP17KL33]